jgi:hypothetical protein
MAGQGSGVHRAQIQEHGYAEGGKVETKEQFKVKLMKKQDPPAPKQKLARAADRQDFADLNGGDAQRETIRVGNTKASYKQAKDFQAEARIDEGKGGIETWNQRQGKVENYAKGGSVAGCHTIVERQMKKHVATPAPKGHKGLKA